MDTKVNIDSKSVPILFDAKRIGESLEEISVEVIQTESQDVLSEWYHSEQDADLFLWKDDNKNIIKQQVSICGQIVEWNIVEGVKTGLIIEDEDGDDLHSGSELIRFDEKPQQTSIALTCEVIRHVAGLEASVKDAVIQNFSESPRFDEIDPDEFLKRFGRPKGSSVASRGFGYKLRRFFKWLFKL